MSYIVALTGGIGSGKTTVANHFAKLGIPLVDADIIARKVVEPSSPALEAIASRYGADIIQPDGSLNRQRLREIIFSDVAEKQWLNALLHPLIHQETQQQLQQADSPYVLWVVPLLFENKLAHLANRVLVIDVTPEEQILRTVQRDNVSEEHVVNILKAQTSRENRLLQADDVITNHDGELNIAEKVATLHEKYMTLAQQQK
ncbi:TPA: dephospho-CoA kinase [Providencia stuartii]|uniref:dephospho-CoA kinase n=1 Tax=Providencia TaxID=586 RepID=UPI00073B188A|nr:MULTISPECIES: dephospho-CoA kinase [Providencia]SST03143.1 coaE [Acinetobacter baumannii]APG50705.1 dephospho-CoA kinase [Providencia stuartii]AVL39558.1 dephospho-CoA kinase [Providencia stuartii]KSX97134.1 dephospho-CoA kinase [Providencia stuartii]MBG5904150.1 dephospho-CoA kinase [Providencia stuartii]